MKKMIIAILGLAVAAGASTGAFMYVKSQKDDETKQIQEAADDRVLFSVNSEDIDTISIKHRENSFSFVKEGDEWTLSESSNGDFSVNQTVLQRIASYSAGLTAQNDYGEDSEERRGSYGLKDPYVLTFTENGQSHTISIGEVSPTGDICYAVVEGKSKIYALDVNDAANIMFDEKGLVSNKLIPYTDNEVVGMTLIKDGETVYDLSFDSSTGLWNLPDEYARLTVNQTCPSTMVTTMTRLTAQQMLESDEESMKSYGFDKPYAEMIIKGSDGTEQEILFSKKGGGSSENIHVYLKNSGLAELYYTADFSFIDYDIFDFIMQNVESANMFSINSFSFKCAEAEDSFTIDNSNGKAECRGTAIDLSNAEMLSIFESFYNSFSYISIKDIDIESVPELKDPIFTAEYGYDDGTKDKIDLVSADGEKCYVFYNGEYTGTLTDTEFMTGRSSLTESYKILCEHIGIQPNMK